MHGGSEKSEKRNIGTPESRYPGITKSRNPVIPEQRNPVIPESRYPEKSKQRNPVIPKHRNPATMLNPKNLKKTMEIARFGYYWLDTWVLANVIQLATQDFCTRFLNHTNDPGGRQYDQMTQAARSAPANIAEGNSRHSTSKETEMKLTDVARATLSELANDYLNWLLRQECLPWSMHSQDYQNVNNIRIERPTYTDDVLYRSSIHILAQKHLFDQWLNSSDSLVVANCMLVLCNRLVLMLSRQIERQLDVFRAEGGFTEGLTAERLAYRTQQSVEASSPACPLCGKPMIRRVAKKGINSGREFWSCTAYPQCSGTRNME